MAFDSIMTIPKVTPVSRPDVNALGVSSRSQIVLLQSLVSIVLCYQILFSHDGLLAREVQEILILGLLLLVAGAIVLPIRLVESRSFTIMLLLIDTTVTSSVIYISGNAGSDLYLAYFLIILISASAGTLKLKMAFTGMIAAAYGGILYLGGLHGEVLSEGHLIRVPILFVMGLFYGVLNATLQEEGHEKGVLIDYIAERKRAEEEKAELEEQLRLSQKLEAVGELAGGIAHDFNNLLTVITGYTQFLLSKIGQDDPSRNEIELIQKAGERAASLTRQLLAFSRRQVLAPKVLDLSAEVADMETLLQRVIGEHIKLVTYQEPALWRVKADPSQIEQVLMNLAVNARDAMPQGGQLTLETKNVELDAAYARTHPPTIPGPYVMLAVSDTGCGMSPETQAHIFEPFFTTKEQGKGTGLGLATVYGIVKQSGGYTWVYSELGKGTTFKIFLPRVTGDPEGALSGPGPAQPLRGSETILLVEDEEMVRDLARTVLQTYGYTVLAARDGAEALRLSQAHPGVIHLLLTDMVMPEMSGPEVADGLTALRPATKVLYMSGYTDKVIVQQALLAPGTAFLEKPFTPEVLAGKVSEVLDVNRGGPAVRLPFAIARQGELSLNYPEMERRPVWQRF